MKTLVVGSSDIDIFITPELKESYKEEGEQVTFHLGDKVAVGMSGITLGGNGANVSVGLARLSYDVSFYTYLGKDILSRQIKETFEKEKVNLIGNNQNTENSSMSLIFDFDSDRIIFSHHEKLDHEFNKENLDSFQALYLTSLGEAWDKAYKSVLSYVQEHPLLLAFSPGSHQLANISDLIYEVIAVSKIIFVNKEEGEKLLEERNEKASSIQELMKKLSKLGPEIVSVTDGKKGSYAYENGIGYAISSFDSSSDGVDKTGSGDAYATGFLGALLSNQDTKTAMRWGAINAHFVIGKMGAQNGLLTREEIEHILVSHPEFLPTTI